MIVNILKIECVSILWILNNFVFSHAIYTVVWLFTLQNEIKVNENELKRNNGYYIKISWKYMLYLIIVLLRPYK